MEDEESIRRLAIDCARECGADCKDGRVPPWIVFGGELANRRGKRWSVLRRISWKVHDFTSEPIADARDLGWVRYRAP